MTTPRLRASTAPAELVSVEERARIEDALRQPGATVKGVARRFHRSPDTIHRIGQRAGLSPGNAAASRAAQAHAAYALEQRLALSNGLFARVEALLPSVTTPGELKDLAMAYAILVDKRRLEEGEATARTETQVTDVRAKVEQRLDELAQRRRRREG